MTDPDADADESKIERLEKRIAELEKRQSRSALSRRSILAGVLGVGGLAAMGNVSAQQNQVGTIGTQNKRVDLFADDVDTNTIDFGSVSNKEIIQSSAVRVTTGEYVVGTSTVDILDGAASYFAVVSGRQQGSNETFVDTLLGVGPGASSPTVANSKSFGADARSYGNIAAATPMSMAANTYDVKAVAFFLS